MGKEIKFTFSEEELNVITFVLANIDKEFFHRDRSYEAMEKIYRDFYRKLKDGLSDLNRGKKFSLGVLEPD